MTRTKYSTDTYCNIEMDSFGHFFFKARTTVCSSTRDPAWNEDFDLELEGSQTLRVLCFRKLHGNQGDRLLGRGALEVGLWYYWCVFNVVLLGYFVFQDKRFCFHCHFLYNWWKKNINDTSLMIAKDESLSPTDITHHLT